MITLSIFISSPGDVGRERHLTDTVINRLQKEFFGVATLVPYFWEWEPMDLSQDYQANIPPPSKFDVVICLLWSRLGSRLGDQHKLPPTFEQTARSGTEYELLEALHGKTLHPEKIPDILVWVNTAQPPAFSSPPLSRQERDERNAQVDALQDFLKSLTQAADGGPFTAAVNTYQLPDDDLGRYQYLDQLEDMLEHKLRSLILKRLGNKDRTVPAVWQGSPFRQLDVFEFEHADIFFGRSRVVGDIIRMFQDQLAGGKNCLFTLIAGASGSGKSSLARAGVLPMLTKPGVIEGIGLWRSATMKASEGGGSLFRGLAAALLRVTEAAKPGDKGPRRIPDALPQLADPEASDALEELARDLKRHPDAGADRIRTTLNALARTEESRQRSELEAQIKSLTAEGRTVEVEQKRRLLASLALPKVRLVLLLDQLEELFTLNHVEDELGPFLKCIDAMARSGRVFVLATLRSDFYPSFQKRAELDALARDGGLCSLTPPSASELSQIIRRPARMAGLTFEKDEKTQQGLDDILRDGAMADQASLPLLELLLHKLYEKQCLRKDGVLSLEDYTSFGGMEGVLDTHAEEVLKKHLGGCTDADIEKVFRCLVAAPGDEKNTSSKVPFPYEDLIKASDNARLIVDTFISQRLLVAGINSKKQAIVEIVHETLLRKWQRIAAWLNSEESRDFLAKKGRLESRRKQWVAVDHNEGYLIPDGLPVAEAKDLLNNHAKALDKDQRDFIQQSIDHLEKIEKKRRALRLTVWSALSTLALLAVSAAIWAFTAFKESERQRGLAQLAEKASTSTLLAKRADDARSQGDVEVSALFALAAVEKQSTPLTRSAFLASLLQIPSTLATSAYVQQSRITSLAWAQDGSAIASGDQTGKVVRSQLSGSSTSLPYDASTEKTGVVELRCPQDANSLQAVLQNGTLISSGQRLALTEGRGIVAAALSRQGRWVAAAEADSAVVHIKEVALTNGSQFTLPDRWVRALAFNDQDSALAVGDETGAVFVVDLPSKAEKTVLSPGARRVQALAWRPGHEILTAAFDDPKGTLQTLSSGSIARTFPAETGTSRILSLAWHPQKPWLASAHGNGDVTIRKFVSDQLESHSTGSFHINRMPVQELAWSPDGGRLVTAGDEGVLRLWAPQSQQGPHASLHLPGRGFHALKMNPAGDLLALGCDDGSILVWSVKEHSVVSKISGHRATVTALAWHPRKNILAAADQAGSLSLWTSKPGDATVVPASAHADVIWNLCWSPDGSRLASSSHDRTIGLWDETGTAIKRLTGHDDYWLGLAFHNNGRELYSGTTHGRIYVWDCDKATPPKLFAHHEAWKSVGGLALNPDGSRLASANNDGSIALWNLQTGEQITTALPKHQGEAECVSFSPDGTLLASGGDDGLVRIWDLKNASEYASFAPQALVDGSVNTLQALDWVPGTPQILSATSKGVACLLDLREETWKARVKTAFPRSLNENEILHATGKDRLED